MGRLFQELKTDFKLTILWSIAGLGLLVLLLETSAPWLVNWPDSFQLPLTSWVGDALGAGLETVKPLARAFSGLMSYPMRWTNMLFVSAPWSLTLGIVTALAWYVGGWRLALLSLVGLGFVLGSGYWIKGMNTLALVSVSVPLALLLGLAFGILAHKVQPIKSALQAVLDIMQTIPTFAYLTPLLLLFGFGPVVGLIASAIYATPPMARNVILGLERVDPEIKDAAIMSGATAFQRLFFVELPAAKSQIMVGVNQCLMASLSMVIIAAVIGGFDDIGWEVLLTMRKAQFGQSLLAGLVIVVFAILIDRISAALSQERTDHNWRIAFLIAAAGILVSLIGLGPLSNPEDLHLFEPVAAAVDARLGVFTAENGASLDAVKNSIVFYAMLPLRIGLDGAVLVFTWGFQWTTAHSVWFFAIALVLALGLVSRGAFKAAALLIIVSIVLETGISELPWIFVLSLSAGLGWSAGGRALALLIVALLLSILIAGLWERALLSLYLSGISVFTCAVLGSAIGLLCVVSPMAWKIVRPLCDMLQTIPLFVFLIPVLMFFQIGEFSAFIAICAYAIVPMIRYTQHGLSNTPPELLEAAVMSGASDWQIMRDLRIPYAVPTLLLGLNQTILYAFAMLVIAALIGTTGLGQSIYLALGKADVGLGVSAGAAMAILALIADRIVQGFAQERKKALGL